MLTKQSLNIPKTYQQIQLCAKTFEVLILRSRKLIIAGFYVVIKAVLLEYSLFLILLVFYFIFFIDFFLIFFFFFTDLLHCSSTKIAQN